MSLLEEYRPTLRTPGDGTVNPLEPSKPRPPLQMKLKYSESEPSPRTAEYRGAIPDCIVYERIRRSILTVKPLDPLGRWLWQQPGYQLKERGG